MAFLSVSWFFASYMHFDCMMVVQEDGEEGAEPHTPTPTPSLEGGEHNDKSGDEDELQLLRLQLKEVRTVC
jgi:hypothetical protein